MNRRSFLVSSFLLGVMHATGIKPKLLPVTAWGVEDVKCQPFVLENPQTVYWNGEPFEFEQGKVYYLPGVSGNYASINP